MSDIESAFQSDFADLGISLPGSAREGRPGKIMVGGWVIWYRYGSDDEGDHLDYYASHRKDFDRHVRLRTGGRRQNLPAINGVRRASQDPVEDARLAAEHFAANQRVAEMLDAKGFVLEGDEPMGVQINRFLNLGGDEEPPDKSG